ncbi:MAG: helix-turn-helix transcriptional regulator [Bacteroidia bacterium]|nr:helix-turn-helix transcriptional regulator [Bacteroidia bacterium]
MTKPNSKIKKLDPLQLEKAASVMRAVAHPSRIAILELLDKKQSCNVTEIHETLGMEQAITSNHLAVLRKKGILNTERNGKNIFYTVNHDRIGEVLECMEILN